MLKKMFKNTSALLLSLSLLMPIQLLCTNAQEAAPVEQNSKYFDVTVDLVQPDYSDLYQKVNDAFPDYPAWDGTDTDPVSERQELFKQLQYERQREYVDGILNEVGLTEERLLCINPMYIVLTEDEIETMKANDKVTSVYGSNYVDLQYRYTVETATSILRLAVGAVPSEPATLDNEHYWRMVGSMGGTTPVYDINQDGRITTLDATWALQCAVGNRGISPCDISDQRIARLMEKDAEG